MIRAVYTSGEPRPETIPAAEEGRSKKETARAFLAGAGITDPQDITYEIRQQYAARLTAAGCPGKEKALGELDAIRLAAIKKENEKRPYADRVWRYADRKFFLLYYPDHAAAKRLLGIRNKEELVFDLSLPARQKVKRQILFGINLLMDGADKEKQDSLRMKILCLKALYETALEEGWTDLELLTAKDEERYFLKVRKLPGEGLGYGRVLLSHLRRGLFCEGGAIHYQATVWYADLMGFAAHRVNPAKRRCIISFSAVEDAGDRALFQEYIRYLAGITDRSLASIIGVCSRIRQYLVFLHENGCSFAMSCPELLERYLAKKEKEDRLSDRTINKHLSTLSAFQAFLIRKHSYFQGRCDFLFWKRKVFPCHHDRSVSKSVQEKQLSMLKVLPMDLRLMYLHLWALGLRAGEVCTIRAGSYYQKDGDFFLRLYQNKMKAEKIIPIPEALYHLMAGYIQTRRIPPDAYVFTGGSGLPYAYDTLEKKLKEWTKACGCESDDYTFRSHDFRHTLATRLHDNGCRISLIRDYLGHKESDMTMQYIDDIPASIIQRNREYFQSHSLIWEKADE